MIFIIEFNLNFVHINYVLLECHISFSTIQYLILKYYIKLYVYIYIQGRIKIFYACRQSFFWRQLSLLAFESEIYIKYYINLKRHNYCMRLKNIFIIIITQFANNDIFT